MNNWINYHHLFYFKTIVEEGSISKAANKLLLKQPTLSAQLKQFEESLGVHLFERKHKQLFLTEQGKIAYDYSSQIFKMGSEMYEVMHDRLKPLRPSLRIGSLDSISKQVILKIVQSVLKTTPCQISLIEGKADELMRELASHKLDIVVSNFVPLGLGTKEIFPRSIAKNNVAFYASPKFKKLSMGFPQSISGSPLIVPTYDSKIRYDLDHWAKMNEIDLNVIIESQDISMKKLMAINQLGLIIASDATVKNQIQKGDLVEIGKMTGVYEELVILTASKKVINPVVTNLLKKFSL